MNIDNIFLTGGTGFFGKALLRHWADLEAKGQAIAQITLLSRDPNRFAAQYPDLVTKHWLHLVQGDVCDSDSLPRDKVFSYVLHAATDSTNGPQLKPLQHFDQIVNGTRNILEFAVASGASRFLLTSSGGVYGPQPPDMEQMHETYCGMPDSLNKDNTYSLAKRCAEHLCSLYQDRHGLECVIARCFTFVGRDLQLDAHFAIGNFIRDALTNSEITVSGDGTPVRSFMDQRDLASWLTTILESGKAGQAYNVGCDQAITIKDLANRVRDILAPGKPVRVRGQTPTQNLRNRYVPSVQKARSELGLGFQFTFEQSILETAKYSQLR